MEFKYFEKIKELMAVVETEEKQAMEESVKILCDAIMAKRAIYTFGASHAGILSEELYYRAGGLMLFNPIFGRELMLDTSPVTLTSKMERCVGYGTALAQSKVEFKENDVLIIHSVSGRNPVTLEIAMEAKKKNVKIIAVTNVTYSKSVTSRHPCGKRLFELADVVLDNHGDVGDACVEIEGIDQKVSPTSTVIGAMMLNSIVAAVAQELVDRGMKKPPIFYSANLDGGDELNRKLYEEYQSVIHYDF